MTLGLLVLCLGQSNEQAIDTYRKASDHLARGAYAECLRLCEDLVKQRPDKEGVLRVRVGAGLEDREFEPRRLAGDASSELARNMADLEAKLKLVESALKWYQASADLKLEKSVKLLAQARAEKGKVEADLRGAAGIELLRRKIEAVKKSITEKVVALEFEAAFAELEKSRPEFQGQETAWKGLRADLEASFARWHEGLQAELRADLEGWKPGLVLGDPHPVAERLSRYRIAPERAAAARLDPLLGWAARLGTILEKKPLDLAAAEALALEGLALGPAPWRLAEGLVLEARTLQVRDPGSSRPLEDRWEAVTQAQGSFAAGALRGRTAVEGQLKTATGARKEELQGWLSQDLPGFERRVAEVVSKLPDRDAPRTVEKILSRLEGPQIVASGKPDGYTGVELELRETMGRATLEPPLHAQVQAGMAVARAYALFLEGVPRDQVLQRCGDLLRSAAREDQAALGRWKGKVSPRVAWILQESLR
jgi:hypothetical protein